MVQDEPQWTEVIKPQNHWLDFKFRELWRYRDLVRIFVWRDFVAAYKQTLLGPLWHVINPVMSVLLYYFVFNNVADIPTDGVPPFLFQFGSYMCWTYFGRCFGAAQSTFLGNAGIFSKVYFPRLAVPISSAISSVLQLGILLAIFMGLWIYNRLNGASLPISWTGILLFPYLMLVVSLIGLGLGSVVAALTTKYRDLSNFLGYAMSLLMYASAVVFPLSYYQAQMPKYVDLLMYNPLVSIMEAFRFCLLGTPTLDWFQLLYATVVGIVLFLVGVIMFNRTERTFIDSV
jgi:lipopolysaccharide transport system permease protein